MDLVFVYSALNNAQLGPPRQFLRVPAAGEFISGAPKPYLVERVMHAWNSTGPIAAVYVSQVGARQTFNLTDHQEPLRSDDE